MKYAIFLPLLLPVLLGCNNDHQPAKTSAPEASAASPADSLRARLAAYIHTKQADIGVAIRGLEGGDTISVNGNRYYTLMSVAKFPQALLLLHLIDEGRISMAEPLHFGPADLKQRTGSTLRKDHPGESFDLMIPEALRYSIGQSDNVTSNKIFEIEGGPEAVTRYVQAMGIPDVRIMTDYGHMGLDSAHRNAATPVAMAQLLEKFYQGGLLSDSSRALLWQTMVAATSGPDRLKGQLPAGTIVGHKTGTSNTDQRTGITDAFNDIGIVRLPSGAHFAIAVFVVDSREPAEMNAEIIAHICKEAWGYFVAKGKP
jgi:beta-lactamase class A